jgi:hypothetical protein
MSSSDTTTAPFPVAPPPWHCKCDAYWLLCYLKAPLPEHAYDPLEAASSLSDQSKTGQFKGGSAIVQILRYHESPVGTYDEMVFVPGYFHVPPGRDSGKRPLNLRVSRIYVSQKDTAWNGWLQGFMRTKCKCLYFFVRRSS